jgi:hypothetical protein
MIGRATRSRVRSSYLQDLREDDEMSTRHGLLAIGVAGIAAVTVAAVAFALLPSGGDVTSRTVSAAALNVPVGRDPGGPGGAHPMPCGVGEQAWGYIAVVRAGESTIARRELGPAFLAQVGDSATGQTLDLVRTNGRTTHFARYFTRWLPVYPQAKQPSLLSCNYLLVDKPADKPLLDAAIAAVVRARYFRSAREVWSKLQIATVSDNPLSSGSLIVTLMFQGPPVNPPVPKGATAGPHPTLYSLIQDTVLEQWAGAKVTGVARGGF